MTQMLYQKEKYTLKTKREIRKEPKIKGTKEVWHAARSDIDLTLERSFKLLVSFPS